ncbi:GumC domain-containing protein [Dysgonomonas termitidis]|uniref:Chromosome segregation protein SMC n=1 Tax=Dysgonomonas termitidis TaxID=1516126 RepID=A0ABV9L0Z1_9BACT
MSTEQKNNSKILLIVIILLLAAMGIAGYYIFSQKTQINELQEESSLNKQQLEDEYENLTMQYEGFKLNIKNDSLLQKLTNEQAKVQRLLEELKTVKADNKAEIARLNNELASLRKILKSYIIQIDSLNQANERLRKEKSEITNKYQEATRTLNEVSQQKQNLTEKVTLAAKLDATGISVQATNSKGKVQKKINKVEQLIINFTITKNITAEPGERTIYLRIMKPDNDVLTKSRTNVFPYENRDINYSIKKIIEYGGEEVGVIMYWNVEEYLMPGTYRVDIFADGSRIGMRSFTLED